MLYCPSCGAANDDSAKYCKECKAKLDSFARARETWEPDEEIPQPRATPAVSAGSGIRAIGISSASLILGLLGTGPVAMVVGWLALRRRAPNPGQAKAGLVLGIAGTIAFAVLIIVRLTAGDPLRRPLTPENVPAFVEGITARADEVEFKLDGIRDRLGPGGEGELAESYSALRSLGELLAELDSTPPELLDTIRDYIFEDLERARAGTGNR
ncbi:MAG: hypothetical protein R6X13_04775 [bacterium]|jgi:hypothetical protein